MQKRGIRGLAVVLCGVGVALACLPGGCGSDGGRTSGGRVPGTGEGPGGLEKRLQAVERLCLEERYDEAVALADEYWFAHPCPIDDVVSGQNTLYEELSESEIRFRLQLASYTKTTLIGSGTLVERFFSYFRTPEIYSDIEDNVQRESSLGGMLRQRALDNPTAVYTMGINVIERDGVTSEALQLMVPAMLACGQWDLAERYIRVWTGLKGGRRKAARYAEVLKVLRASAGEGAAQTACAPETANAAAPAPTASNVMASTDVAALAEKITSYGKKGLTDYLNETMSLEAECRARWAQNPASQNVLECILLYDLLYKNLEEAASLLPAWLRLGGQTGAGAAQTVCAPETAGAAAPAPEASYEIPQPLLEMFWIMQTEGIPVADSLQTYLARVDGNEDAARNFGRFLQARALWLHGGKTPAEITSEFGSTFSYNYYFSRFITPPPALADTHRPLAH